MQHHIFDQWNNDKKSVQFGKHKEFFVNQRDVWYTKMGINIGSEESSKQDFRRPVLVLKKVGSLFFTVALTTKGKDNHRFYHKFTSLCYNEHNAHASQKKSHLILSQVKVMDKKRFVEYMGYVGEKEFGTIQKKLQTLLL